MASVELRLKAHHDSAPSKKAKQSAPLEKAV